MSSLEPRAWRALGAVGLAVAVVIAVGAGYLRPWQQLARPAPASTPLVAPRPAPSVQGMQFLTPNVGWVLAEDATSSTLLGTADGGRHWQRRLQVPGGQGRIGWFRFFDARHGVVHSSEGFNQVLRRTSDGGQHWTSVLLPGPTAPGLLFFADPDHGWCLVPLSQLSGSTFIVDRQEVALFRTTDGGTTWREVLATSLLQPVSQGLGDDGRKAWIWFRDLRTGWIGQTTPGPQAVVYATEDGGDDWSQQELPPPDGGWASSDGTTELMAPAASAGGWVLLDVSPIVRVANGFMLRERYVYVRATDASAWSGPLRIPGAGPAAVQSVDGRRWWGSDGPNLLVTDDAGDHWRVIGQSPAGQLFVRLAVVDANHVWAVLFDSRTCPASGPCRTSLARSTDGGRHWTSVRVPV